MSKRYKVVATVCTDKVGSECVNEYELDENDMEGFLECKDERSGGGTGGEPPQLRVD